MKKAIQRIPVVGSIARGVYRAWIRPVKPFSCSKDYWNDRYESGGHSGDGSYRKLAEFKAEIINAFVLEQQIKSVIEYGCGDGNQLKLAEYPSYIGFDVSAKAVSICQTMFPNDASKSFHILDDYRHESAELTLSLDVIFHLIEDQVFFDYMQRLFASSNKFVIIYASDTDANPAGQFAHVKHRQFSRWVGENQPAWRLIRQIPNRYPFRGDPQTGSFADFFLYQKT